MSGLGFSPESAFGQNAVSTGTKAGDASACTPASSIDVSNVTATPAITGLQSNVSYQLRYVATFVDGNALWLALLINSDSAAHYTNCGEIAFDTLLLQDCPFATGYIENGLMLGNANGNALGTNPFKGTVEFSTVPGSTGQVIATQDFAGRGAGSPGGGVRGKYSGFYSGTAPASITIEASTSGSMSSWGPAPTANVRFSGHFDLWKCGTFQ